jgi:hypothetical protein
MPNKADPVTKLPTSSGPEDSAPPRDPVWPTGAIREAVLAALGHPPELYRVAVLPLWARFYRVNVFTGTDPTKVAIAHSYFIAAADDGRVVSAVPPLVRSYP